MTVDDQIGALEDLLSTQLQYALFVNININYWEELDELDNASIQVIRDIVRDIFGPLKHMYRGTTVVQILEGCAIVVENVLVASLNVPFPRDPILHVHAVIRNVIDIFIRTTYARLRTEMIMVNHNAHVLQRVWREAITNPARLACRRRLLREFENMVVRTPVMCQEA